MINQSKSSGVHQGTESAANSRLPGPVQQFWYFARNLQRGIYILLVKLKIAWSIATFLVVFLFCEGSIAHSLVWRPSSKLLRS